MYMYFLTKLMPTQPLEVLSAAWTPLSICYTYARANKRLENVLVHIILCVVTLSWFTQTLSGKMVSWHSPKIGHMYRVYKQALFLLTGGACVQSYSNLYIKWNAELHSTYFALKITSTVLVYSNNLVYNLVSTCSPLHVKVVLHV